MNRSLIFMGIGGVTTCWIKPTFFLSGHKRAASIHIYWSVVYFTIHPARGCFQRASIHRVDKITFLVFYKLAYFVLIRIIIYFSAYRAQASTLLFYWLWNWFLYFKRRYIGAVYSFVIVSSEISRTVFFCFVMIAN